MVPPKHSVYIVQGEATSVMASMRRNSRWASTSALSPHQDPLIEGFLKLHHRLSHFMVSETPSEAFESMDPIEIFSPFLQVIKADNTTGWITGAALMAVEKFLECGLLNESHPEAPKCVRYIADSVIRTHFEATDMLSDEVVLMKIMQVLKTLIQLPSGRYLTNEIVCDVLQSCFGISFQMRLTEILRRYADSVLVDIVRKLFTNLSRLEDVPEEQKSAFHMDAGEEDPENGPIENSDLGEARFEDSLAPPQEGPLQPQEAPGFTDEKLERDALEGSTHDLVIIKHPGDPHEEEATNFPADASSLNPQSDSARLKSPSSLHRDFVNPRNVHFLASPDHAGPATPYGIPCLREILRYLTGLVNPNDHRNTDTKVRLGLSLLTVVFETCGHEISAYHSFLPQIRDKLCRNLLKVFSTSNLILFSMVNRVLFLVFECLRSKLKIQFEFFINILMTRVKEEHGSSSQGCLLVCFETLLQFCHLPSFFVELYLNYDCNLYCSNLFTNLMNFLSKNSFPTTGLLGDCHLLALDAMLCLIDSMETRCRSERKSREGSNTKSGAAFPNLQELTLVKSKKAVLTAGVNEFNKKPQAGLDYLQKHGLLQSPFSAAEVASFFLNTPSLDKVQLGEYLGAPKNTETLQAFIDQFDFTHCRIDEALRTLLETFRLPGESQVIDRIMMCFSRTYAKYANDSFTDADSLYVLSFSIIMLNVDQHNPGVKRRMTEDDFIKNNRGINGGKDFPRDYLAQIYKAIKENEIIMPAEREGELADNYMWTEMLKRSESDQSQYFILTTGIYDRDLFQLVWGPFLFACSYIYEVSPQIHIAEKSIQCFSKCSILCFQFGFSEIFDELIKNLCRFIPLGNVLPFEDVSIAFGRNRKTQIACKTLFSLVKEYGNIMKEGWLCVLEVVMYLHIAELLPASLLDVEDFLSESGRVSLLREEKKPLVQQSSSLFSSFANYLLNSEPAQGNLSSQEVEDENRAKHFVATQCNLQEFWKESKFLKTEPLLDLVLAAVKTVKSGRSILAEIQAGRRIAGGPEKFRLRQEESIALILEFLVDTCLQNRDRIVHLWDPVMDLLSSLISDSNHFSFLVERAIVGFLNLSVRLLYKQEVYQDIFNRMVLLSKLSPDVETHSKHQIICGLCLFLKTNSAGIQEKSNWALLFSLLEKGLTFGAARGITFETLAVLIKEGTFICDSNFDLVVLYLKNLAYVKDEEPYTLVGTGLLWPSSPNGLPPSTSGHVATSASTTSAVAMVQPIAVQIMALLFYLHCRVPSFVNINVNIQSCWPFWSKLLSIFSEMCSDHKRYVRQHALTYIQRSLLIPEFSSLSPLEWRSCFEEVLFPMLSKLLDHKLHKCDPSGVDESRMRASALLSKVFLQHLQILLSLDDFPQLWIRLLNFMDKFLHADNSDLMAEAVPECLKNMLLVMSTAGVIVDPSTKTGDESAHALWSLTWGLVDRFAPNLRQDLFPPAEPSSLSVACVVYENPKEEISNSEHSGSVPLLDPVPLAVVDNAIGMNSKSLEYMNASSPVFHI